jgi:hypothetical protein
LRLEERFATEIRAGRLRVLQGWVKGASHGDQAEPSPGYTHRPATVFVRSAGVLFGRIGETPDTRGYPIVRLTGDVSPVIQAIRGRHQH